MSEALPAGWGYPTASSRKEHWWAEGDPRSGCGRYGRIFVPVRARRPPARFTCKACERKAEAANADR